MTRADVIEHLIDTMRLHGFVGSNASLPATSEDVTGLLLQLEAKGDELTERLLHEEEVRPMAENETTTTEETPADAPETPAEDAPTEDAETGSAKTE